MSTWAASNYFFGYFWYVYNQKYGALSSPPIFKDSNYCYFRFYYLLRGQASLSVYIEELNGNNLTSLWSSSDIVNNWKKKVIRLPQTSYNYSVVLFGYFSARGDVIIDDTDFIPCDSRKLTCFFSKGEQAPG